MEKIIFKSYNDLVEDIRKNIHKISEQNFDLIVGIPRSGMIPAYLISAYLNIDCTDVDSYINNHELQRGQTRTTKGKLKYPQDAKNIILVDDSVYSGASLDVILKKIPIQFHQKITTLAIYSSSKTKTNLFFEFLNGKKLFEWGIFHNNMINKTCIDIDGVICRDPILEENDDGEKYLNFIKTAEALFLPTGKIYALVSNRLEKYRTETEQWLKNHNVEYENLILLNLKNKEERLKIDCGIEHKGKYYKNCEAEFFIESSYNQSLTIAQTSGKPVYCVSKNMYIEPDLAAKLLNNPKRLINIYWTKIKHLIKIWING